jgi:DnaJ-class molecular chaperone with C-terminal Zn finger domain
MDNYYQLLGIDSTASQEVIRKAYHRLALENHPDKCFNQSSSSYFVKIQEAKEILLDSVKREKYDRNLKEHNIKQFKGPLSSYETLETLEYDANERIYYMDCRCQGIYVIEEDSVDYSKDCIYIQCDNCTFYIEIKLSK